MHSGRFYWPVLYLHFIGGYKMLQDKIFATMQSIVNSAAYPYLLGAGFACFLAYIIVKGL